MAGTTPGSVTITLNPAILAPGTYYGTVNIMAPGAAAGGGSIGVVLTILPFVSAPSGALVPYTPAAPVPTGSGPRCMVVSDFNGDGRPDIATANQNDGTVTVLLQGASGNFTAAPGSPLSTLGSSPYALATGDFNNDGVVDLAVVNNASNTVSVFLGNGSGGFRQAATFATGAFPVGVAIGDFNVDRKLDIAVINAGDSTLTVLTGDGTGSFTPLTSGVRTFSGAPSAIGMGDFNNDGRQDLVVTSAATNSATILLGGPFGFSLAPGSPFTLASTPYSVAVGDWNDDGTFDLAFGGAAGALGANAIPIYLGVGNGSFTAQAALSTGLPGTQFLAITSGDIDGDGNADLVYSSASSTYIALGNGSGGFSGASSAITGGPTYSVQVADFNGDGRSDLAIANDTTPGSVSILIGTPDMVTLNLVNTSGGSQVLAGSPVTLSALAVSTPGLNVLRPPSGNVTFMDGASVLGTPALSSNSAVLTTSALTAGNNAIRAVYNGDTRTTGATSGNISIFGDVSAATLAVSSGSPQTVSANAQFAALQVIVNDANGLPIQGVPVTFTAPGSGASGTFAANATVLTNSQGIATAPILTANSMGGSFVVIASASPGLQAIFTLNTIVPVALRFVPVTPCRVADTRGPAGPFGAPAVTGQTSRTFLVSNSACGIPATAQAYSLNVTVVPVAALGYLTLYPAGAPQPLVSTLNSDGRVKSNAAIVPAGSGGGVTVFASNTTNIILDVDGYFVPATNAAALAFYPLTPCRVADTRLPAGPLGGPYLPALSTRSFAVQSACSVPPTAQAYSVNFSAISRAGTLAYLTVWPTGQAQPNVSTLNAVTGTIVANAAVVPAGTGGAISVFATNDTDLAIDINGYFAPAGAPGGLSLYNLQPCRILDTRLTSAATFSGVLGVTIASSACGAPATAQAFALNATVVPTGSFGYLTLWAQGAAQPVVSTLNALDGAVTANLAIVPTTNGGINAFATSATSLVLDLVGYFAP